jgi:DNA-binding response OmpR family regulator
MGEKILVVDDEPGVVKLVSVVLAREGYEVIGAFDGEEALKRLAEEKPDLVVLDIAMPGMDGWEVCTRIKENPKHKDIPVIMLTALGHLSEEFRGLKMGAVKYIVKPFNTKDLVVAVDKVLGKTKKK